MASAMENVGTVGGMAATGATIGSVIPVVGTALGAGVGGLIGLGSVLYDELIAGGMDPADAQAYVNEFQARQAPTNDYNYLDALRRSEVADADLYGQQQAQIDMLRANAEGRGVPSLAEMQLARALTQNQANAAGTIASQRGLNPALAARLVSNQQASMAQEAAGQGAMLRAQEQLAAQQLLGQTLASTRGQSQGMYGAAGGFNQGQNALNSANFNQAQNLNAQVAENNAARQQQAQNVRLGIGQQQERNRRDSAAGIANMGSQAAAFGSTGGFGQSPPPEYVPPDEGFAHGTIVPGRAVVQGDHPVNDVVPAMLTPGEGVIPRSIMQAPDAPARAAAFVARMKSEAEQDPEMMRALYAVRR